MDWRAANAPTLKGTDMAYGAQETNGIEDYSGSRPGSDAETVALHEARLARITRLRLISDPGHPYWDVSYCWGELEDGTPVRVQLPFRNIKRGPGFTRRLVTEFKLAGRHAKNMGVLDNLSLMV